MCYTGYAAAKIVSLPHELYVSKGKPAEVRCQFRNDDNKNHYYNIINAIWYRNYQNGTIELIGSSGRVYAERHKLKVSGSITQTDEGIYFCCIPHKQCGISESTIVRISSKAI